MERSTGSLAIADLRSQFLDIEFPEYQREPDVWSRDQKQRLIDSILRQFDISSIYFYRREDSVLECIDGRQRLNAIMSFLGSNDSDTRDNGFSFRSHNEISSGAKSGFELLDGESFSDLEARQDALAHQAVTSILGYELTVVYLSGATEPDEFNLQFLRLNLGTLINAGEKLHAMVGDMRDLLFDPKGLGLHPFFDAVRMPTRRFAKEQTAAQILLQAFSKAQNGEFTRARHFDLQRFLKSNSESGSTHPVVEQVSATLDALDTALEIEAETLRNRAATVSVVLLAWDYKLYAEQDRLALFGPFLEAFFGRLRWQVANMKGFKIDERYDYLVEFQRHLTQASVEKPAVTRRHELLGQEFDSWVETGELSGDADYRHQTGEDPPSM